MITWTLVFIVFTSFGQHTEKWSGAETKEICERTRTQQEPITFDMIEEEEIQMVFSYCMPEMESND